jgi:hypothetical protein
MKRIISTVARGAVVIALADAAPLCAQQDGAQTEALQTIAALEQSIDDLEHRIQRLKDTDAIENLVSAYGYYLDKALWDHLADLFAEDATMEIAQRGVYLGKARIRAALELFGRHGLRHGFLHNHMQLQPVIHVAPDGLTAKVRSRAISMLGQHDVSAVWGDSVYENELVKESGVWKIKKDHLYTTFFAPYEGGWVKDPRPAPGVSDRIPPDQPPTEVYEAFPSVYIPPYHYANPVTGRK